MGSRAEGSRGHWNYRLTVQTVEGVEVWTVRELHYDDENNVTGWTENAASPYGESWQECAEDLLTMSGVVGLPAYDLDTKTWVDDRRKPISI